VRARFGLVREPDGFRVLGNEIGDLSSPDPDMAAGLLDALVRARLAQHAPDRIFVHAGVVAYEGRAIVLPGRSMSGKTTLVAALVGAGALYYSEEYAVLDRHGMVHPYPKPLSIRANGGDLPVERLGGVAGTEPVPAGLVALTSYAPGTEWRPARLSRAQGVLELLAHTLVARERPEESLVAATRLASGAVVLKGDRGEAADAASALLAALAA
jgi:energy-coupling factor transporter ATP-binding protein EcfA2